MLGRRAGTTCPKWSATGMLDFMDLGLGPFKQTIEGRERRPQFVDLSSVLGVG